MVSFCLVDFIYLNVRIIEAVKSRITSKVNVVDMI